MVIIPLKDTCILGLKAGTRIGTAPTVFLYLLAPVAVEISPCLAALLSQMPQSLHSAGFPRVEADRLVPRLLPRAHLRTGGEISVKVAEQMWMLGACLYLCICQNAKSKLPKS